MPCEPAKPYTSVNCERSAYCTCTHSGEISWLIAKRKPGTDHVFPAFPDWKPWSVPDLELVHACAAVDDERLAGDEIAIGGSEEGDGAHRVFRALHALQR